MNALAVVLSALLAGVILLMTSAAPAAENHEVLLLEPVGYPDRWLEAEHRVEAELETAGFRVVRRSLAVSDQEGLMRSLVNSGPAFASFVMLREGPGGAAFVWLSGTARIKRFAMSDVSSSRAAGAIALRVTEYLNMQVLTITVPPPDPLAERDLTAIPASPPLPTLVADLKPSAAARWGSTLIWLGPSAVLSSDADSVGPGGSLGLAMRVHERWSLELDADLVPLPLLVESSAGTTRVGAASLRLFTQFEARLLHAWSISVGLGVGFLRVNSESEALQGFRARADAGGAALMSGRGRLVYRADGGFAFLVSLDPGLSLPTITIRSDNREVARLARPWVVATMAVGWSF